MLVNTLKIYRALVLSPPLERHPADHYVSVPVQLIVSTKDPVRAAARLRRLSRWVPRLWRRDIQAGHWSPMSHPQVMATAVSELVDFLGASRPAGRCCARRSAASATTSATRWSRSPARAAASVARRRWRSPARAPKWSSATSTRRASKETAAQIAARGGVAHPYMLDVVGRRGRRAVRRPGVRRHTACPTSWSTTPASDRPESSSTRRQISGTGCSTSTSAVSSTAAGHSASGWSSAAPADTSSTSPRWRPIAPLKSLNAYCTSKAAVYMFSDCLRAELMPPDVGLTTICPGVIDTNIVQHHAVRRDRAARMGTSRAGATQLEKMFAAAKLRSGQGRQGHRVRGEEEQADPARRARGLPALRHVPDRCRRRLRSTARVEDRCRAAEPTVQPFAAMSSSTANIVRVGTPVPPLPV